MNITAICYILTIIAGLAGLWITTRIYHEKHSHKPMVCPMGANCDTVVHSEFSTFFGIGLELYGAAYYAFIALSYTVLLILLPYQLPDMVNFLLVGFSICAFLFSIYLTFVQAFYIKSWCTWCLFSAGISTLIFTFTAIGLSATDFALLPILVTLASPILIMHIVGFTLGVGGATIGDIMFLKFLRDFEITPIEHRVLQTVSQTIWIGLLFIILSGIGLYLPNADALNQSPAFTMKLIVFCVIICNSTIFNLLVGPKLVKISCSQCVDVDYTHSLRRTAFMLGAISFFSWYTALALLVINPMPLTITEFTVFYSLLVLFGILASQVLEGILTRRFLRSTKQ